jgi:hypothetical protein
MLPPNSPNNHRHQDLSDGSPQTAPLLPYPQDSATQAPPGRHAQRSVQHASPTGTMIRGYRWGWLIFLLVLGGALWAYYGLYADPPIVTTPDSPLTAPATEPYQVMYVVQGTSRDVSIRYGTDAGMVDHPHVSLPFQAELTAVPGSVLLMSVENHDLPSTVFCTIYVDGNSFARSAHAAVNEQASCSGRR